MPRLTRHRASLFYLESGKGSPPVLLVHGWCCDHTYMAAQYRHLRPRHRVVSVDLLGHGRSDKPLSEYSIHAFAEDLRWVCRQLGLDRPVVIGHSMGGLIALEMAAQEHGLLAGAVLLDSPLLYPENLNERNWMFAETLREPGFRQAQQEYTSRLLFLPADDPARKARIVEGMSRAPQHVMAPSFESLLAWDNLTRVDPDVPVLLVSAAHLLTDLRRARKLHPKLMTAQTAGAGHFLHMEVPSQVNAMIDRFVATAAHGQSSPNTSQ